MAVSEADAIKDLTDEEVEDLKETFRTFDKVCPHPSRLWNLFSHTSSPLQPDPAAKSLLYVQLSVVYSLVLLRST